MIVGVRLSHPELMKTDKCDHGVSFNEEEARDLNSYEIRKRWPRLYGTCPKGCGYKGIAYASMSHYLYGDW